MNTRPVINTLASALVGTLLAMPNVARSAEPDSDFRQDYQLLLEEAERARIEAEEARAEAGKAAELAHEMALSKSALARQEARQQREEAGTQRQQQMEERALQEREMARVREELGRAHRELREASREIAAAHRNLAGSGHEHRSVHRVNLGDRAVIGVVLGQESADGVKIIGVAPGGPAELAGLQVGDVLLSIRGESLAGGGRETLFRAAINVR